MIYDRYHMIPFCPQDHCEIVNASEFSHVEHSKLIGTVTRLWLHSWQPPSNCAFHPCSFLEVSAPRFRSVTQAMSHEGTEMVCLVCPVCEREVAGKSIHPVQKKMNRMLVREHWLYSCRLCQSESRPLVSDALFHFRKLDQSILGVGYLQNEIRDAFRTFVKDNQFAVFHDVFHETMTWGAGHRVAAIMTSLLLSDRPDLLSNTGYHARGTWLEAFLGKLHRESMVYYNQVDFALWHLQLGLVWNWSKVKLFFEVKWAWIMNMRRPVCLWCAWWYSCDNGDSWFWMNEKTNMLVTHTGH